MSSLSEQVKNLRDRLAKDSHNSHLPPSSDRFGRKPKSLRTKSEKQSGGQPGHPGSSLQFSSTPDEIIELQVDQCEACQHELHAVAACGRERRQVVDLPSPRVVGRNSVPTASISAVLPFQSGCRLPSNTDPTLERRRCIWSNSNSCHWPADVAVMSDLLGV